MATPSGPQRRDTAGQCPLADSSAPVVIPGRSSAHIRVDGFPGRCCVVPTAESAPGRGCRHHPFRVIPKTGFARPAAAVADGGSGITIGPGEPRLDEDFGLPAWQLGRWPRRLRALRYWRGGKTEATHSPGDAVVSWSPMLVGPCCRFLLAANVTAADRIPHQATPDPRSGPLASGDADACLPRGDGLKAGAVPRLARSLPSARTLPASGRSTAGGSSPCCGRCKGWRLSARSRSSAAVSGPAALHRLAAR